MTRIPPKPVKATAPVQPSVRAPHADAIQPQETAQEHTNDADASMPIPPAKERVPFGAHQPKLALPARHGYQRRWFHDTPGRIQRAIRGGWSHVVDEKGQPVSQVVGVAEMGGGLRSFAMEIPIELYEADMAAQQRVIDEFDELMQRGAPDKTPGDDGRYVPEAAPGRSRIEVRTTRRAS